MSAARLTALVMSLLLPLAALPAPRAATAPPGPRLVHQGSGVVHDLYVLPRPPSRASVVTPAGNFPRGFVPDHFRAYLDLTGDGAGETIGIVVAYHNPSIVDDVNAFSEVFALPQTCGSEFALPDNCFDLVVRNHAGAAIDPGWALETALDVEWAHAIAPRARIVLVEARDDELPTMMRAVGEAIDAGATVVSGSWGDTDAPGNQRYDRYCRDRRAICVFATGDSGNPAAYPATSPAAIAVGGTSLKLTTEGSVVFENAWEGSGGGLARFYPRPRYQLGVHGLRRRGTPDVSYHADPVRPYAVYTSVPYGNDVGWLSVGGTSGGAPQWAAIIAVANGLRVNEGKARLSYDGFSAQRALYGLAGTPAMFDVTSGANGACGALCTAGVGYDFVTGSGSPRSGVDVALADAP